MSAFGVRVLSLKYSIPGFADVLSEILPISALLTLRTVFLPVVVPMDVILGNFVSSIPGFMILVA